MIQRYEMQDEYEPYTGQHIGIIGVPDNSGEWVRYEDAQRVKNESDALAATLERLRGIAAQSDLHPHQKWDMAQEVIKQAEGGY